MPQALDDNVNLKTNRSQWPMLLGVVAGVLGAIIGWVLIRDDVHRAEAHGHFAGGPFRFLVSLAIFAAVITYFVARRLLIGPDLRRDEWTLVLDAVPPATMASLRTSELARALEALGYRLAVFVRRNGNESPIADLTTFVDNEIVMRDTRARHGELALTLNATTETAPAWGSIAVADTERGTYDELAQYLIATLGARLPGLQHKRTFSNLSPDESASLLEQLPDRPVRLP